MARVERVSAGRVGAGWTGLCENLSGLCDDQDFLRDLSIFQESMLLFSKKFDLQDNYLLRFQQILQHYL